MDKNIQIGECKYSGSIYEKYPNEMWIKGNRNISDEYVNYLDWQIDFEYSKPSKDSSSGMVTILRKNIPIKENTGFSLTKTSWLSSLNLNSRKNEIDTSKSFFNSLYYDYSATELKEGKETSKFLDIFVNQVVGNNTYIRQKMETLLFNIVKRSLGGKTDFVGVFKSIEGIGKTEFITDELFGCFKDFNLMNENAKLDDDEWKFKDKLADYCITFIEESGIGEKAHNQFKNMTSLTKFKIKPKGENNDVYKHSRSTMIFSTNENQFIYGNDVRNRRFLVFDLMETGLKIHDKKSNKWISIFKDIDFKKIWSEQYQLLLENKEVMYLDLWDKLEIENRKYVVKTTFKSKDILAINLFEQDIVDYDNGIDVWLSSKDVLTLLKDNIDSDLEFNKADQDGITKAMAKMTNQKHKKCKTELMLPTIEWKREEYYENKLSNRYCIKIKYSIYEEYTKSLKTKTIGLPFFNIEKN